MAEKRPWSEYPEYIDFNRGYPKDSVADAVLNYFVNYYKGGITSDRGYPGINSGLLKDPAIIKLGITRVINAVTGKLLDLYNTGPKRDAAAICIPAIEHGAREGVLVSDLKILAPKNFTFAGIEKTATDIWNSSIESVVEWLKESRGHAPLVVNRKNPLSGFPRDERGTVDFDYFFLERELERAVVEKPLASLAGDMSMIRDDGLGGRILTGTLKDLLFARLLDENLVRKVDTGSGIEEKEYYLVVSQEPGSAVHGNDLEFHYLTQSFIFEDHLERFIEPLNQENITEITARLADPRYRSLHAQSPLEDIMEKNAILMEAGDWFIQRESIFGDDRVELFHQVRQQYLLFHRLHELVTANLDIYDQRLDTYRKEIAGLRDDLVMIGARSVFTPGEIERVPSLAGKGQEILGLLKEEFLFQEGSTSSGNRFYYFAPKDLQALFDIYASLTDNLEQATGPKEINRYRSREQAVFRMISRFHNIETGDDTVFDEQKNRDQESLLQTLINLFGRHHPFVVKHQARKKEIIAALEKERKARIRAEKREARIKKFNAFIGFLVGFIFTMGSGIALFFLWSAGLPLAVVLGTISGVAAGILWRKGGRFGERDPEQEAARAAADTLKAEKAKKAENRAVKSAVQKVFEKQLPYRPERNDNFYSLERLADIFWSKRYAMDSLVENLAAKYKSSRYSVNSNNYPVGDKVNYAKDLVEIFTTDDVDQLVQLVYPDGSTFYVPFAVWTAKSFRDDMRRDNNEIIEKNRKLLEEARRFNRATDKVEAAIAEAKTELAYLDRGNNFRQIKELALKTWSKSKKGGGR